MTLALLHALRDIGVGLLIAVLIGGTAYVLTLGDDLEAIERADLADFEQWEREQRTPDWQWPVRPAPLRAEYVAKPKARVR